jgi:CubicO group peptidase (beta-lactamase class C family)
LTIVQLAMTDALARPFAEIMKAYVLDPAGMKDSTFEQPLPVSRELKAARAHGGDGKAMGPKWHVYPEQAAAGLWTTPSDLARFVIDLQKTIDGNKGGVLEQRTAREMITPIGVGPFSVGLVVEKRGEGWYFNHSGGNWGFSCDLLAHVRKGHGVVVMTNGENGGRLISEIEARVATAYGWDSLDKPLPR